MLIFSSFHEKLRRFIKKEQQDRAIDQIPVRVTATGTLVTLRGPEPAVEALAAKVNAFVEQAKEDEKERGFTLSFDFPQKHANQLIGKSGSNIKDLRERFDVEIKVDDGKVELKGPKAKAEAAKSHISTLGRQWADEATYTLKVDPKYHRELIGAGGAQINRLQTRYKVQIHFPRSAKPLKDDQSNVDAASEAGRRGGRRDQEPDEVVVKGPKKGADEARDEILSLLQYLKDNSNVATVSVQGSQIPSLIGQRGSGMDEIRQSSGARIDIPNARDSSDLTARVEIQIKGTKDQVAKAKKLIEAKRDVFDQTVTKTLEVDKKHHRALIGTGGSALRDIVVSAGGSDDRRELARTVQFPKADADGNLIKVEGKSEIVDKIIAAMQKIVAERESQTTETIDVATDKHRSLIGRGGETKKELESKFRVSIDIPRQGSGQTSIKITGLPADVKQAKTHILDLVKDQEGETVQVPRKVHNTIADNGQFFRRLRNDLQVTVDHAGHKVPPKTAAAANARANGDSLPLITDDADAAANAFLWNVVDSSTSDVDGEIPWILRGPSENIPKAKSTLAAAIEQALKNTTTGYLVLSDPGTYRRVIGQGGSKVNSIRKATGCKITVPRNQAKDEAIEIIGTAEGVEKAKEMVLKAVKDGASGNGGNGGYGSRQSGGNGSWD
jgi:polyribonucleotide nucleotidyltransferase